MIIDLNWIPWKFHIQDIIAQPTLIGNVQLGDIIANEACSLIFWTLFVYKTSIGLGIVNILVRAVLILRPEYDLWIFSHTRLISNYHKTF